MYQVSREDFEHSIVHSWRRAISPYPALNCSGFGEFIAMRSLFDIESDAYQDLSLLLKMSIDISDEAGRL